MISVKKECCRLRIFRRPHIFAPPFSGNFWQIGVRWPPVLHVYDHPRVILDASIAPFEPVIEPAYGLIAPLDGGSEIRLVGPGMVPRADDRLDRSLRLHQHVGHVVAIAILQTAD